MNNTEKRKGRQTPTKSIILPYSKSLGQEAVNLYNRTNRKAQEWQENMCQNIMAVNDDGLWTHTKFGYSVPRRNGKNEVVAMRELYGLVNGEKILHTAHRTTTSHSAWERLCDLLIKAEIPYSSIRAMGREEINVDGGGSADFRTRSTKGGLGEGFDLLIIDEAQEYQDDQESALKYVVTDSKNPQTIFCGTPPTPVSSGTVFLKMRNATLQGGTQNTGWAEWSVEKMTDVHDIDAWYECNPSLGTIFTERSVADEIGNDDIDFNIQRLGLWLKYNQKSAVTENQWAELRLNTPPKLASKLFVGIKFGKNGKNVALSIASKMADGGIFVECVDCQSVQNGLGWIIAFLASADIEKVVIDGANGQQLLANQMKEHKLKPPILPTVKEIILANSSFEQGLFAKEIKHCEQPSLTQVITNCSKRAIGSSGGFGYCCLLDDAEIALMDSVIYAYWACKNAKEHKKQTVSY